MFNKKEVIMKKIIIFVMLILIINACAVNAKSKKSSKPKWLTNPKKVYPEQLYLTAIGEGDTRSDAENMAAANLSKIFESVIHSEENVNQRYMELTNKKGTETSDYTSVNKDVNISSSQKLFNIKFAQSYTDKTGRVHVLAYINRVETSDIYQQKIDDNSQKVRFYIEKSKEINNPIKKYAYLSAAMVFAQNNKILLEQLRIIDSSSIDMIKFGYNINDLSVMLSDASRMVTFSLSIKGDDGRITSILEDVLTGMGFVLGENGVLKIEGSISFNDTDLKRNDGFKFVRYYLDIKVKDVDNNIILAINEKGREGHLSFAEAKERCIRKIEKKLKKKFKSKLVKYFDSLVIKEK